MVKNVHIISTTIAFLLGALNQNKIFKSFRSKAKEIIFRIHVVSVLYNRKIR